MLLQIFVIKARKSVGVNYIWPRSDEVEAIVCGKFLSDEVELGVSRFLIYLALIILLSKSFRIGAVVTVRVNANEMI